MKPLLLALAQYLIALSFPGAVLPPTHPLELRAERAADAVSAEVDSVYAALPLAERQKRARVAIVWGFYESAWQANPQGSNDLGRACGYGQVHVSSLPADVLPAAMTCAAIRADLRTSVRAHLLVLRWLEGRCAGSFRDALTAYAIGKCPVKDWTISVVAKRCALAGGC